MNEIHQRYEAMKKARREAYHGATYLYNYPGKGMVTIGVCLGIGQDIYIVAYITETGARRRIKTKALPALTNPDSLQTMLDAWAADKRLQEVKL